MGNLERRIEGADLGVPEIKKFQVLHLWEQLKGKLLTGGEGRKEAIDAISKAMLEISQTEINPTHGENIKTLESVLNSYSKSLTGMPDSGKEYQRTSEGQKNLLITIIQALNDIRSEEKKELINIDGFLKNKQNTENDLVKLNKAVKEGGGDKFTR